MKKQPNDWLIFSSLAFQIGIIMYCSTKLGRFLDQKFDTSIFTISISSLGLIIILYLIYKQSKSFWEKP
ncbi:MAG: AtpZ/AtpI family protein [Flavobacteriales bacterium]